MSDAIVDQIIDAVVEDLGDATFGDGKIFIREIAGAVRVRTNERDEEAL